MSSTETPLPSMCGHADQRADGDDAGAADAGDEDVEGLVVSTGAGIGQRREVALEGLVMSMAFGFSAAAFDGDERRAEPFRHEKSLLQADWSICRFGRTRSRPARWRGSSTAPRNRRSLRTTASLMNTRRAGSTILPRLRRRRFRWRRSGRR